MTFRKLLKTISGEAGTRDEKLLRIITALQTIIPFDFFVGGLCFLRIGFDEYQVMGITALATVTGRSEEELKGLHNNCNQPFFKKLFTDSFQLKSHLENDYNLCVYSRRADAYTPEQVDMFESIGPLLMQTIGSLLQEQVTTLAKPVAKKSQKVLDEIIGKSHLLLNVFDHLAQVAPSDTSVLILGESGTGKEKIASSIHQLSARNGKPYIKLNCAALSASLIESELFGHEKGAFTGALDKRMGIFERADKGTLFLDEVGDMTLELQVKLLRVLQEKEIERVGGRDTIKVDVRIIAATNKNLEKEVADGRFRLDLYYRLNVFPITLPALRERKEDIPALAYHFMNLFADKAGKKLSGIPETVLKKMMAYDWPGNIRELEHMMERSVLLTKSAVIEDILLPTVGQKDRLPEVEEATMKTIAENERDYIIAVLRKCNGRIWGPGAAAEILNLNPSTLKSKMKKLGIRKEYIH